MRVRTPLKGAELTAELLRSVLHYDPHSGAFTWLETRSPKAIAGTCAGTVHVSQGGTYRRVQIRLGNKNYGAHRLAWLYAHGEWPPGDIDHKDGDATNNALGNLRLATKRQNQGNRGVSKNSHSGVKGVCPRPHKKRPWAAFIAKGKKSIYLGAFETVEAASDAYDAAARKLFGEFARARENDRGRR
jgi:hypothetical protein